MKIRTQEKGITLIALIITIIVMLLLVGVTINVALNGGLFGKAEKASYQTNLSTIKEQLALAKVTKIAENSGNSMSDYGISIDDLQVPESLKKEFGEKLVISKDADLYYDSSKVTAEEKEWLKEIGITEYTGEPTPPSPTPGEPTPPSPTPVEPNMPLGLYGSESEKGFKFLEDGTGKFYYRQNSTTFYEGNFVYDETTITLDANYYFESNVLEYSLIILKNDEGEEINELLLIEDQIFTNNSNASTQTMDGKSYRETGEDFNITISFSDGYCNVSNLKMSNYYLIYEDYIYLGDDGCYYKDISIDNSGNSITIISTTPHYTLIEVTE